MAKFVWLGQKLGISEKSKEDTLDYSHNKILSPAESNATSSNKQRAGHSYDTQAATASMFPGSTKQPAVYHGLGSSTDSPLTKRTVVPAISTA